MAKLKYRGLFPRFAGEQDYSGHQQAAKDRYLYAPYYGCIMWTYASFDGSWDMYLLIYKSAGIITATPAILAPISVMQVSANERKATSDNHQRLNYFTTFHLW
nr:hypothetical protein [Solemya elarraichensis gill symbiont]